jgi:hypothetical protein
MLLLLAVVAGVGGGAESAVLGQASIAPVATLAAASTNALPVSGDRRAVPALGSPSSQQYKAGWLPRQAETADVPAADWQPPLGLINAAVAASPAVVLLTIQVSHRGRAPPAASLLT